MTKPGQMTLVPIREFVRTILANSTAKEHRPHDMCKFHPGVTLCNGERLIKLFTPETVWLHEREEHPDTALCVYKLLLSCAPLTLWVPGVA